MTPGPMTPSHDDIIETALGWIDGGGRAALATVIETWGSAPRPVGSLLAISGEAALAGSVSGGCVEGAVAAEALEALEDGTRRTLEFGVSDADAFAVGLACGGTIRVLVEPVGAGEGVPVETLRAIAEARAARRMIALATDLETGERRLLDAASPAAREAARVDKSGLHEIEGRQWFLTLHNPPLRMAVIGAVHIAQPLMQMARLAGFDPVLIDPRDAFATAARFPGETILREWPDAALGAVGLDARVAVVCLTHDPKLDDPALTVAVASPAFYIGALGSKKTTARRVERLSAAGIDAASLARINAPIGLDIGAKSPAEIAVSIMGEVVQTLRRPS